jgi:hypothetical protein
MLRASAIRLLAASAVDAVHVDLQQDRDAMPGTAGDIGSGPSFPTTATAAYPRL